MDSKWYAEHPIVSTVLWFMGGPPETSPSEEEQPKKIGARSLSWKDEHDGPIAEYIGSPKELQKDDGSSAMRKKDFDRRTSGKDSTMSRKSSLTTLPRNDSDVSLVIHHFSRLMSLFIYI
jgi:hypothetical protein